jgi:hypothetical protein
VIEIDGTLWFVAALVVCGAHVRYLRSWRKESRERLARWSVYDAASQARHDEFMLALARHRRGRLGSHIERGQA